MIGEKELIAKINKLKANTGLKDIRKAGNKAMTPAVRAIRAAAPIGERVHKTYKGRYVTPGFLKRSINKSSRIQNGEVDISIRVKGEAFYGQFIERGTKYISKRPWFFITWARKRQEALRLFETYMRANIRNALR